MAKVMIVDDAKIMRVTLKMLLEKLGHEVIAEAANGHEALDKLKRLNPEVITMDITMPEVNGIGDGIDTVKHIRQTNKEVKIIMITSHGEQKKVIDAIKSGATSYALKPIEESKLDEIIKKVLG